MEFEIAVITALSALLGVALTMHYTNKQEKTKFIQELKIKQYDEIKTFYVYLIASLEKVRRYTEEGRDYDDIIDEGALLSAKANLISPIHVNEKLAKVSEALYIWSSYYRKSLPTKLGDTQFSIISTEQGQFGKKADETYPNFKKEMRELLIIIKTELQNSEKGLAN